VHCLNWGHILTFADKEYCQNKEDEKETAETNREKMMNCFSVLFVQAVEETIFKIRTE
jgi:hypothetical protein